ncbi:MAG: UbiA family prenyltransferase [Candidatus Eisenbacteria bacterium]
MNGSGAAPGPDRPASLPARLWRYQAERFPLAGYAPLITAFTFASVSYSRSARRFAGLPDSAGFVPWPLFVVGAFTSLACFLLLRVLDEHKDAETDRRWRPELPVPRGLVSLGELRGLGAVLVASGVAANALVAPVLLLPLLLVAAWAALMTKEFFVRVWLRAHVGAYLVTHMLIMPMIDAYTTGIDWLVAGRHAPSGLPWFLAATFANGVLVEIGRKLRAPADERQGVDSYTRAWGVRRAPLAWLLVLAAAATVVTIAARSTGAAGLSAAIVFPAAALLAIPAVRFVATGDERAAKQVELTSGLWGLISYLTLGFGPMLAGLPGR